MAEFDYAKGRISESIQFISREIKEFEDEYTNKSWQEYQNGIKLQKLIDRTVENILTALIEVCGTILIQQGVAADNYSEVLKRCGHFFGFTEEEQEKLARLAIQRNRLAHCNQNFRWNAIKPFSENRDLVINLIKKILEREMKKTQSITEYLII